ncbi:MAG: hypothetical protein QOD02_1167 [Mycobacterium sp.]|jgi:uncharacterized membrane protein HdeD (DUF308 family)|nr:hypothetical protein [Mycobacterium sp.]
METLLESRLWKYAMVWGALSAVLGGLILAWPGTSILVASTLFGVYLLVSGLGGVAMAFTLPESAGMRVMLFISGVLSVILAVLCFRNFGDPYPVLLLSIWIGVSFIVQGFAIVSVAISYETLPSRGWYGFLGVLSVIAGAVVLIWPWDSIAVLTLATGIWLVVMGIVEIVWGFQMRSDSKTVREVGDVVRDHFHQAKKAS